MIHALALTVLLTPSTDGMVWVPPGTVTMGSNHPSARADERPAHRVDVDGFWMDETEVTNAQFRTFVEATGYVTTAERPVDWNILAAQLPPDTPRPPKDKLVPASAVFVPPPRPVSPEQYLGWWQWTPEANWRHPEGPESSIDGRDDHPVVHISWDDAVAYATWAGKELPTEAQWERAARFDHDGAVYAWGNSLLPEGKHQANLWQGDFPYHNKVEDGHRTAAPTRSFPPNTLGLYELCGNVWEWTADSYRPDTYQGRNTNRTACQNPIGPAHAFDPRLPQAKDVRVQKGGSFLCHVSYCSSYRPSAKMGATPDSTFNHTGFRCVKQGLSPKVLNP